MSYVLKAVQSFIEDEINSYFVAYSGGLDSSILLLEVQEALKKSQLKTLKAIHINHNYSKNSKKWEEHCQNFCSLNGIELLVFDIDVSQIKGASLEDQFRKKRYEVFNECLKKGGRLFTGHHEDDNIETLFLRLLRGTGLKGARSIPIKRNIGNGDLARPFLNFTKSELKIIAEKKSLVYLEDESNKDIAFDRNYIRNLVLPSIEERWPSYRKNVNKFINNANNSYEILSDQVEEDINYLTDEDVNQIDIKKLKDFSPERQKNIIIFWINLLNLNPPNSKVLNEIIEKFLHASKAAEPKLIWGTKNKKGSVCLIIKKGYLVASPLS